MNTEVQKFIVECLFNGMTLTRSIKAGGITKPTFYYWKTRYENGDPEALKYADFFDLVETAGAAGEAAAIKDLRTGRQGWQAQAWYLERRFPQRWGRKDRTPEPLKPPRPSKPLADMTQEEIDAYDREVADYERRTAKG